MPAPDGEASRPGRGALSGAFQRELARRARALKASVQIGGRGLSDGIIAQVRQALRKHELIKIKVHVDKGADADEIGRELAESVPCHIVQRIGKVLVAFAPTGDPSSPAEAP
jgi:RNA-binding protein